MNGTTVILTLAGINTITLGIVVYAVKKTINSCLDGMEKRLDSEREDRIKIDNALWDAVNRHGHKGLSGNDARVTR